MNKTTQYYWTSEIPHCQPSDKRTGTKTRVLYYIFYKPHKRDHESISTISYRAATAIYTALIIKIIT